MREATKEELLERIKELEAELKERKQICKDLASQPCGYLVGDK